MTPIEKAKTIISRLIDRPSALGGVGYELCELVRLYNDEATAQEVRLEFWQSLEQANLTNAPESIVRYFCRLADHESELIFEEMFKLIILRDEIESLSELQVLLHDVEEVDSAFRRRIARQPKLAGVTLPLLRQDWNRTWWWYALR